MKSFSDLCISVKDQCEPATSGASVYVGLEHIDSGAFFLNRHGKPSDVQSSKTRFRKGDVLYGKLRPYLDKAVIAPVDGICSTDILVFRPNADCCATYLLGLIHTTEFRTHADQTTNGVNHPRTSWHGLAGFRWDVPAQSEQEKIAATFWKIQRAIEVQSSLIAAARELKQSTLSQLFSQGLRSEPQKSTPYGVVPKSWEIKALSEWAVVRTGATKGRLIPPEDAIEVPYLRVANVQDGHLDLSEMKNIRIRRDELEGYCLQKDDVVLTEGGDFDKLGRGFIWEGQIDPCIHQNHIFAVRVNRDHLWPRYFAYLAQSPYGKEYFLTVAHKTTNLACINTTKLRAFPALRPELDEQKEIAAIMQTLDLKISVHERKRAALSDLFQTMLHQLMTAQIRVDKLHIDTSEVATPNPH
jgi:type I restriction enzyme S subunit